MITSSDFYRLVDALGQQAADDIHWSENGPWVSDAKAFATEAIFVVCNSGMKNTVAKEIFRKCLAALNHPKPVIEVFGHVGKAAAIERLWAERDELWDGYLKTPEVLHEQLAYLESLPWIGPITKYHLAKNLGVDVAKPDVHLQRLADRDGCSVQALCERLGTEVLLRAATVDVVLWRACANGVLDSRTGLIKGGS